MNPTTATRPRILLAEDDPVSAAFLCDAMACFPAEVDPVADLASARATAIAGRHDLLLIDAHLPDASGVELLAALRTAGIDAPAVAHTAERDTALRDALLAHGFLEVLAKPLGVAELHAALARHLPRHNPGDWNDAAALSALGGDPAHVQALRGLFLRELPAQRARIRAAHAAGDEAALRAELHRLSASCGFVGATRLAGAVHALQGTPTSAEGIRELEQATEALLAGVAR